MPIYVGYEKGFFAEAGLAPEIMKITEDVAPLMATGELDCFELTPDKFKPMEQGLECVIIDSLQVCNFLKLNEEELHYLSQLIPLDPARPEAACRQLIRTYGLCLVVLTCGASRSYAITSDKVSILPTPRVDVADTVGAGDAFSAALCAAMIKGKPLVEAHRLAVDVSAYVCTHHGAMHALPQALRSQF